MRTTLTPAPKRKQVIVRFDEELITWITNKAKSENKSFNSYMVEIVKEKRQQVESLAKLRIPVSISPEVLSLSGIIKPFTEEEISSDDRLSHILRRHE